MLSERGISDAWLLGTPHRSHVAPTRVLLLLWAAFDLNLMLCAVKVKALGLQDAVQLVSSRISHLVLCASCLSIKLLALPALCCAFPIKGSWEFNCFWKTKQNSMFGTDTVLRWQSQAEIDVPLPQAPALSPIFMAAYIKSKHWSPAAPKAEGPQGCGMLWKLCLTDLQLMKIFALLDNKVYGQNL